LAAEVTDDRDRSVNGIGQVPTTHITTLTTEAFDEQKDSPRSGHGTT
jgi:hypothetical protein